jgi:hypothetical protein
LGFKLGNGVMVTPFELLSLFATNFVLRNYSPRTFVCSEVIHLVDATTAFASSILKLTGGDNGKAALLTLVVARQTKDLTQLEVVNCVAMFERLHEAGVISDGAAATERGEKKGHLHLQCCFWLPSVNRNGAEVQAACMELVYEHAQFAGARRHVCATIHDPSAEPNVTWQAQCGYVHHRAVIHSTTLCHAITMCISNYLLSVQTSHQERYEVNFIMNTKCRYVMKDKDEPHFTLPFAVGGCSREFLLKCLADYQVVASYKYNKDGQLQPENYMRAVNIYINKHLSPLDVHPLQAIRLMLLERYYQLGEKWCKPGTYPWVIGCNTVCQCKTPCIVVIKSLLHQIILLALSMLFSFNFFEIATQVVLCHVDCLRHACNACVTRMQCLRNSYAMLA